MINKIMYIAMLVFCGIAFAILVAKGENLAAVWSLITAIWVGNAWMMWSNSEYWRKKFQDMEAEAWKRNRDKFQNGGYHD